MSVKYNIGDTYTIQQNKNEIEIDTLTKLIGYTTLIVFIQIVYELFVSDGPLARHKRYMLRNFFSSTSWMVLLVLIVVINLAVYYLPVKTDDLKAIQKMQNLREAILIGTVLFLTAFLTNLGYTVGLFFISGVIWYIFRINILSPVSAAKGYTEYM